MKKYSLLLLSAFFICACGESEQGAQESNTQPSTAQESAEQPSAVNDESPANTTQENPAQEVASSSGSQLAYEKYCNDRFEFCIEHPKDFIADPPPQNGDGRTFRSADGKTVTTAWGSLKDDDFNTLDINYDREIKNQNNNITYKTKKDNYFVVSGTTTVDGVEKIFYQKTVEVKNSGTLVSHRVEYPVSQKETYNPYCDKINKGLK